MTIIRELCTSASSFIEYVQARYDRLRVQYDKQVKQSDAFRETLAERVDQTALIEHLKSKLLRPVRARHAAQEKANHEITGIRKHMDDAGHRLVVAYDRLSDILRKAKDKKSQCKKAGIHIEGTLRRISKQVEGLQAEFDQAQDTLTARSAECYRLRCTVSDREVALN